MKIFNARNTIIIVIRVLHGKTWIHLRWSLVVEKKGENQNIAASSLSSPIYFVHSFNQKYDSLYIQEAILFYSMMEDSNVELGCLCVMLIRILSGGK